MPPATILVITGDVSLVLRLDAAPAAGHELKVADHAEFDRIVQRHGRYADAIIADARGDAGQAAAMLGRLLVAKQRTPSLTSVLIAPLPAPEDERLFEQLGGTDSPVLLLDAQQCARLIRTCLADPSGATARTHRLLISHLPAELHPFVGAAFRVGIGNATVGGW